MKWSLTLSDALFEKLKIIEFDILANGCCIEAIDALSIRSLSKKKNCIKIDCLEEKQQYIHTLGFCNHNAYLSLYRILSFALEILKRLPSALKNHVE